MATSGATATDAAAGGARDRNVIYEGDTVICQTSDGRMFFQAVKKDECVGALCALFLSLSGLSELTRSVHPPRTIRVGKKLTSLGPVIGSHYG